MSRVCFLSADGDFSNEGVDLDWLINKLLKAKKRAAVSGITSLKVQTETNEPAEVIGFIVVGER